MGLMAGDGVAVSEAKKGLRWLCGDMKEINALPDRDRWATSMPLNRRRLCLSVGQLLIQRFFSGTAAPNYTTICSAQSN